MLRSWDKSPVPNHKLMRMELRYEPDTVLARQRAKELAAASRLSPRQVAAVASVASEAIRMVRRGENRGWLEIRVFLDSRRPVWAMRVWGAPLNESTSDPIRPDDAFSMRSENINAIRHLVDHFDYFPDGSKGAFVTVGFNLPKGASVNSQFWEKVRVRFQHIRPRSSYDRVRSDQDRLIQLTEQLRQRELELKRVNAELQETNQGVLALYAELEEKARELEQTNQRLQWEIEERKRAEAEREYMHQRLLRFSRLAGMAEVASDVLHGIGNTLNSIVTSVGVLASTVQNASSRNLRAIADELQQNRSRLAEFITTDARGRKIPDYLIALAQRNEDERAGMLAELQSLQEHIDYISRIIAAQQSYARTFGMVEPVAVDDLVHEALLLFTEKFRSLNIDVDVNVPGDQTVAIDRHKTLQILVHLINNAIDALEPCESSCRKLAIRAERIEDAIEIEIRDNGVGIAPDQLSRIFQQGFTTKKNGNGYALHHCALVVKEMGGSIIAESEGPGKGAAFILHLPIYQESHLPCTTN